MAAERGRCVTSVDSVPDELRPSFPGPVAVTLGRPCGVGLALLPRAPGGGWGMLGPHHEIRSPDRSLGEGGQPEGAWQGTARFYFIPFR